MKEKRSGYIKQWQFGSKFTVGATEPEANPVCAVLLNLRECRFSFLSHLYIHEALSERSERPLITNHQPATNWRQFVLARNACVDKIDRIMNAILALRPIWKPTRMQRSPPLYWIMMFEFQATEYFHQCTSLPRLSPSEHTHTHTWCILETGASVHAKNT